MCEGKFQIYFTQSVTSSAIHIYIKFLAVLDEERRNRASRSEHTKVLHVKFPPQFTSGILLEVFQHIPLLETEEC